MRIDARGERRPRSRDRRLAWAVHAALFLVLTACGSPGGGKPAAAATATPTATAAPTPSATTDPATLNPCDVVTLEEASALAGTPLDPGTRIGQACTYFAPVTGPTAQVAVYVGDKAKQILDTDRLLGNAITAVPGIGDEAYEEDDNVFVRKGTIWCAIHLVRLSSAADNKVPLEVLLGKAAARL